MRYGKDEGAAGTYRKRTGGRDENNFRERPDVQTEPTRTFFRRRKQVEKTGTNPEKRYRFPSRYLKKRLKKRNGRAPAGMKYRERGKAQARPFLNRTGTIGGKKEKGGRRAEQRLGEKVTEETTLLVVLIRNRVGLNRKSGLFRRERSFPGETVKRPVRRGIAANAVRTVRIVRQKEMEPPPADRRNTEDQQKKPPPEERSFFTVRSSVHNYSYCTERIQTVNASERRKTYERPF